MPEVSHGTRLKADLKNVVAAEVQRAIKAGRTAGLTSEEAVVAALIGAVCVIRVDGMDENRILKEVQKAVPQPRQYEGISVIRQ